ncbi:MAG: hypothetical protein ACTHZI_09230 [Luteimonas sp.]
MAEIMLRDVDDVLLDRIGRIASRCGWDLSTALMHVLEQGLHAYEGSGELHFEGGEADVLRAAFEALTDVPDDPGFAMIGRPSDKSPLPR